MILPSIKKFLIALLALLLAAGPSFAQQYSERYEFIKALKDEDITLVRQKIASGQNVNVRDGEGVPALHIAHSKGGIGWVALLLREGADPNIANQADGKTMLMIYAERGDNDGVEMLLRMKADPNLIDSFGETALTKAVRARQFRVVQMLLDKKARLDIADSSGLSVLDHARQSRDRRIEKLLLDAGAQ